MFPTGKQNRFSYTSLKQMKGNRRLRRKFDTNSRVDLNMNDMFIDMPYDPDALSWLLNIKAKEGEFIICKEYNENGGKLNVILCVEGDQSFSLFKTSYKPEKKDYMLALQREGHRNELLPFSELKNLYTMMGVAMKQIKPIAIPDPPAILDEDRYDCDDFSSVNICKQLKETPTISLKEASWENGKIVILKTFKPIHGLDKKMDKRAMIEASALADLSHRRILEMVGFTKNFNKLSSIATEMTEYGNLYTYLKEHFKKDQDETATLLDKFSLAIQVAEGLEYIASKGYVHRNICAKNIFVTKNLECKIGGFSKIRKELPDINTPMDYVTIELYTAHESLKWQVYSRYSDMWAFGVLFVEILTLGTSCEGIETMVRSGFIICPGIVKTEHYRMISKCWFSPPNSRPEASEIVVKLRRELEAIIDSEHSSKSRPVEVKDNLISNSTLDIEEPE